MEVGSAPGQEEKGSASTKKGEGERGTGEFSRSPATTGGGKEEGRPGTCGLQRGLEKEGKPGAGISLTWGEKRSEGASEGVKKKKKGGEILSAFSGCIAAKKGGEKGGHGRPGRGGRKRKEREPRPCTILRLP